MSRFWNPLVSQLDPYVPGEQPNADRGAADWLKLNTNENPYGPSPAATAAIHAAADERLRQYPDPNANALKDAIAALYGIQRRHVFVGNGSDEVLAHVFLALLKQAEPILLPDISYSFYPVYCGLHRIAHRRIPLNARFEINLDDYRQPNGGIIFANPNAPTGHLLTLAAIEALLQRNTDSVVVVDEAYIDFAGVSAIALIRRYPNLLIVQTVSKSRALAGLRVGFAIGDAALIEGLERVKNSFNSYPLDHLAIQATVAALGDQAHFDDSRRRIIANRAWLAEALRELGFDVLPSHANFILTRHPHHDARTLNQALRARHILVRHFDTPRIDQYLRISIGAEAQCRTLVAALRDHLTHV